MTPWTLFQSKNTCRRTNENNIFENKLQHFYNNYNYVDRKTVKKNGFCVIDDFRLFEIRLFLILKYLLKPQISSIFVQMFFFYIDFIYMSIYILLYQAEEWGTKNSQNFTKMQLFLFYWRVFEEFQSLLKNVQSPA